MKKLLALLLSTALLCGTALPALAESGNADARLTQEPQSDKSTLDMDTTVYTDFYADCTQDAARYIGVPIVRIDEEMCRDAVRRGTRIGVMATLPTTLEPTKNTVKRVAREMNREITLVDSLVDGAFGLDQDQFRTLLLNNAEQIKDKIDILLLCQGSMAYCEEYLEEKIGVPVVSSPKYGAAALKEALKSKGVL